MPKKIWRKDWTQFANSGEVKGQNWRNAVNKLAKELRKENEQDTWKNRHSPPDEMIAKKT